MPFDPLTDRLIDLALEEDLGSAGDVTCQALGLENASVTAELWAKERLVVSGLSAFARVFAKVDAACEIQFHAKDGDATTARQKVATVRGPVLAVLVAERTALNIVQRMSGIATAAAEVAKLVRGTRLKVLDTRKTPPGLRKLSKDAVRHGGLFNHRTGLFDGVLIKDNHIAALGSVSEAVRRARAHAPRLVRVEVEVGDFHELDEALAAGADIVMLDNMTDAQVAQAVKRVKGRAQIEVSGGVTAKRLSKLAKLGVDFVSMGALTHSARAVDFSLEMKANAPKTLAASSR